jgi:hypothetical protein
MKRLALVLALLALAVPCWGLTVSHTKHSDIADGANANLVQPSDWNAVHTITGEGVILRTTADVSNATTTFADITGLSFPALANTAYEFHAVLVFQSNTTTTGIKFSTSGPSGVPLVQTHIPISLTSVTLGAQTAFDTGTASASVAIANQNYVAFVDGVFVCGATPGDFKLRFAAETTGTVLVKAGSFVRGQKLD